jgi:hypothetical protein
MKYAVLFSLILLSCQSKISESQSSGDSTNTTGDSLQPQTTMTDQLHDSDYGIFHLVYAIHPSEPPFGIRMHIPDNKVYVFDNAEENGEPIQEFPLSEDIDYEEGPYAEEAEKTFDFADFNFDGYKDLLIVKSFGSSNIWYDVFIYDRTAKKFLLENTLSGLTSPQADSAGKKINYHDMGGMAGGWYTDGTYGWIDGKLTEVRKEDQTSSEDNPEVFIRTISIADGSGGLKVASKVRIEQADGGKEKQCLLEGEWEEFDKRPKLLFAETQDNVIRNDGRNGSCE